MNVELIWLSVVGYLCRIKWARANRSPHGGDAHSAQRCCPYVTALCCEVPELPVAGCGIDEGAPWRGVIPA